MPRVVKPNQNHKVHKLEGIKVGSRQHSRNQQDHTQVMDESDNKEKKEAV